MGGNEKRMITEEIEELFRTVTESLVATIDSRDPITAGHSMRVAIFVSKFCDAVNRVDEGFYKGVYFSESEKKEVFYAALLHDIGKIGVSERILMKEERLNSEEFLALKYKIAYHKERLINKKREGGISNSDIEVLYNLDNYISELTRINAMDKLSIEDQALIDEIGGVQFVDLDGSEKTLLNNFEKNNLLAARGNLTVNEWDRMTLHPMMTYEVLKDIKWSKDLIRVPEIAAAHHEKLNGMGYPLGLKGDEILIQSRMLAIVDVYDALTAKDRMYKAAVSLEATMKILRENADYGELDKELCEIFIKERVYE